MTTETFGYRLATSNDMIADVLQRGHRAAIERWEYNLPTTDPVRVMEEVWVLPSDTFSWRCGHDIAPRGRRAEIIFEYFDDWFQPDRPNSVWDTMAEILANICNECHERRIDGLTDALDYMDTPGPRG